MTPIEPQPAEPPPHQPFQFSLRTMLLLFVVLGSSLGVFGGWGIVAFGLVVGLAVHLHQVKSLSSLAHLVLVVLCLMFLIGLLLPPVNSVRDAARRLMCTSNLKQIAAALQAYHQANGCFPPAYIADKSGKPIHSWRLLILPYLDYNDLHKAYDFTQPWDGPKNKARAATSVMVYDCPCGLRTRAAGDAQTDYVAVVGPNAAWTGDKPRKLMDFGKDASRTIMVVEVANSGINWAEPRDLSLESLGVAEGKSPALVPLSKHDHSEKFLFTHNYGVNVAMADGSVQHLWTAGRSNEDLRKVLQIGAYTTEEIGSHEDWYGEERHLNWPNIAALAVWLLSVGTLLTLAVLSRKRLSVRA